MKDQGETKPYRQEVIEFVVEDASPFASSGAYSGSFTRPDPVDPELTAAEPLRSEPTKTEISPAFKLLSEPRLPELPRDNRARLQMQSPNRLYFYWSLKDHPFRNASKVLGRQSTNYAVALKLVDLTTETETLYPAETEGSWWFDVEDGRRYRAEIGLYAVNRPYVRILFSNAVETPLRGPSPSTSDSAEWMVSSDKFSQVLDVAGFARDAFEVALTGDDPEASDAGARAAFRSYIGGRATAMGTETFSAADLRRVLLTIAAGGSLATLQGKIGPNLFSFLSSLPIPSDPSKAASVLSEYYDVEAAEFENEETTVVFGASRIHFPRRVRTRRRILEYSPISSFTVASS